MTSNILKLKNSALGVGQQFQTFLKAPHMILIGQGPSDGIGAWMDEGKKDGFHSPCEWSWQWCK